MICLIIVTFNRSLILKDTLNRVFKQSLLPLHVIVVDNCSVDETEEVVNSFKAIHANLIYLKMHNNMGYAYGLSKGIDFALNNISSFDYFMFLDDDSLLEENYISTLYQSRLLINQACIIGSNGFVETIFKGPLPVFRSKSEPVMNNANDKIRIYDSDFVLVDGALIDKVIVSKIGLLRADFFMMCEDFEYSRRIKKAGYSVFALDIGHLIKRLHLGGGKFSGNSWRGYYHARNHILILKQYFSFKSLLSYIIRQGKLLVASVLAPDRFDRMKFRILGIYHGCRGISGKTIDPLVLKKR